MKFCMIVHGELEKEQDMGARVTREKENDMVVSVIKEAANVYVSQQWQVPLVESFREHITYHPEANRPVLLKNAYLLNKYATTFIEAASDFTNSKSFPVNTTKRVGCMQQGLNKQVFPGTNITKFFQISRVSPPRLVYYP